MKLHFVLTLSTFLVLSMFANGTIAQETEEQEKSTEQKEPEAKRDQTDRAPGDRGRRARRRRGRGRNDTKSLKIGQMAPTFKLNSFDGESETDVAEFIGKKPVVLFFGSYT